MYNSIRPRERGRPEKCPSQCECSQPGLQNLSKPTTLILFLRFISEWPVEWSVIKVPGRSYWIGHMKLLCTNLKFYFLVWFGVNEIVNELSKFKLDNWYNFKLEQCFLTFKLCMHLIQFLVLPKITLDIEVCKLWQISFLTIPSMTHQIHNHILKWILFVDETKCHFRAVRSQFQFDTLNTHTWTKYKY